ncbi:tetratricopeptide repeat protein [Tolypothrix sp. VBCCA 56010]|uniref:tetratricopeptide repeat protein n=1 Tax=Tolypothrix sp. VBCCA 56010 TaxID=3137731 RepID=UPI003D7E7B21
MTAQSLSVGEAIRFGFDKWRKNLVFFLILSLFLISFNFLLLGLINLQGILSLAGGKVPSELFNYFNNFIRSTSFGLQLLLGSVIFVNALTNRRNIYFFVGILIVLVTLFIPPFQISIIELLSKVFGLPVEAFNSPIIGKASPSQVKFTISIANYLAQIVLGIGTTRIGLKLCDNGRFKVSDLFSDLNLFLEFLFAFIVYFVLLVLGYLFFIIPGILLTIRLQFYSYFILDRRLSPIEAIKKSFAVTKNFEPELILLLLLINLLSVIVSLISSIVIIPSSFTGEVSLLSFSVIYLLPIITTFITTPLQIASYAFVYHKLTASGETIRQSQALLRSSAFGRASLTIFLVIIYPFVLIFELYIVLFIIGLTSRTNLLTLLTSFPTSLSTNPFLSSFLIFLLSALILPMVLIIFFIPSLSMIGIGLGINGVLQKNSRRVSALVGLLLNSIALIYTLILIIQFTLVSSYTSRSISKLEEGRSLATQGRIKEAVAVYKEAEKSNPAIVSALSWNELCWSGSLHNHPSDVIFACDKAVIFAPGNPQYLDSRGLARALTGDTQGAIEDFQAFVDGNNGSPKEKLQRQAWIDALRAGKNPFTPEELESLRNQSDNLPF